MHTNTFEIIENTVEYEKTNVLIYKEVDTTAYGIITYKIMSEGFIPKRTSQMFTDVSHALRTMDSDKSLTLWLPENANK